MHVHASLGRCNEPDLAATLSVLGASLTWLEGAVRVQAEIPCALFDRF